MTQDYHQNSIMPLIYRIYKVGLETISSNFVQIPFFKWFFVHLKLLPIVNKFSDNEKQFCVSGTVEMMLPELGAGFCSYQRYFLVQSLVYSFSILHLAGPTKITSFSTQIWFSRHYCDMWYSERRKPKVDYSEFMWPMLLATVTCFVFGAWATKDTRSAILLMGPSLVGRYGRSMIYINIFTRLFEGPIANIGVNLKNTQESMVCVVKLKTDFEVDFIEAVHAPVKS